MANLTKILAAGAVAVSMAGSASAATFSLNGSLSDTNLSTLFGGGPGSNGTFYGSQGGLAAGDAIKVYNGGSDGGLFVNGGGKYKLTLTLVGFEARATDAIYEVGDLANKLLRSTTNLGESISMLVTAGYGPFGFSTIKRVNSGDAGLPGPVGGTLTIENGGASMASQLNIGFGSISADGRRITVLFDDGRTRVNGEGDFDDMIMVAELAPIPVPAAGFLLAGALGALGVMRRRKTA